MLHSFIARPFFGGGVGINDFIFQKAKKKQKKQGKISTFFRPESGGEGKEKKSSSSPEKPTSDVAGISTALPGGRSGAKVIGVRFGIGDSRHHGEGRAITVEYEKVTIEVLLCPEKHDRLCVVIISLYLLHVQSSMPTFLN